MLNGGNATIYVSDMDRAVTFYCRDRGIRRGRTDRPRHLRARKPRGRVQGPVVDTEGRLKLAFFADTDGNPLHMAELERG